MRKRYEVYNACCESSLGWFWTLKGACAFVDQLEWSGRYCGDVGIAGRNGMTIG